MTSSNPDLRGLVDGQLLTEVKRLAACERQATVALIAALAEVDRRRLYLDEGYASLFTYATDALRLSESAAYRRIEAARVVRRFPIVLERLAAGDVTLTTVTLLRQLGTSPQPSSAKCGAVTTPAVRSSVGTAIDVARPAGWNFTTSRRGRPVGNRRSTVCLFAARLIICGRRNGSSERNTCASRG